MFKSKSKDHNHGKAPVKPPAKATPLHGLQASFPTSFPSQSGPPLKPKSDQDPTKGLRNALKLKDVEDLSLQVAALASGSK
jgi:hypothetical protein